MTVESPKTEKLAVEGGRPAKQRADPPMYPGGMLIDQEEEQAVLDVLRSKRLFRYYGPNEGASKVEELERAFAAHVGTNRGVAVSSGTAALTCGLRGIGIGPGAEVIVPAYTWIASPASVLAVGAVPVIAEVDESLTLDPVDVEAKITTHTRAIMPVHMRGAPCRMKELMDIAERHGLRVIEDVAQACGGSYRGRRLGSIGDVGCFSFQFNKIITSGEGGMVATSDEQVWRRSLIYHDVIGSLRSEIPPSEITWGTNYRLSELLAAVALVQLRRLDGLLAAMRERKRMLVSGLQEVARRKGITTRELADPQGDAAIALILFLDVAATAGRVAEALRAENIGASVLYHPERSDYHVYAHWTPILERRTWAPEGGPWRWARRDVEYAADMCPRSLDLLGRAVHLDVSPLLTNVDVEETLDGLNRVLSALA